MIALWYMRGLVKTQGTQLVYHNKRMLTGGAARRRQLRADVAQHGQP